MDTIKQKWEEFEEKLEKDGKENRELFFKVIKTLRGEKSGNMK